jgi:hypothetical protein
LISYEKRLIDTEGRYEIWQIKDGNQIKIEEDNPEYVEWALMHIIPEVPYTPNPEKIQKKCFILTPIGEQNTAIRRETEGVIGVLSPVLKELGFTDIAVAHRMPNPGSITSQIVRRILEDDLVIANLTHLNPNVMYELAIRHAVRKPVVHICEYGIQLPFDIIQERTIFYCNDFQGHIDLARDLRDQTERAILEKRPDNPIYRAIQTDLIMRDVSVPDSTKIILERLESLENRINLKMELPLIHTEQDAHEGSMIIFFVPSTTTHINELKNDIMMQFSTLDPKVNMLPVEMENLIEVEIIIDKLVPIRDLTECLAIIRGKYEIEVWKMQGL